LPCFQKLLTPFRTTLKNSEFVAGEAPGFSDYILFGAFRGHVVFISKFPLFNANDPVHS